MPLVEGEDIYMDHGSREERMESIELISGAPLLCARDEGIRDLASPLYLAYLI